MSKNNTVSGSVISACRDLEPELTPPIQHKLIRHSSFADVSNYHYAGRMGNRGYRPSPAVQTTAFPAAPMMASNGRLLPITPTTPSHRRPIFRSSVLEDHCSKSFLLKVLDHF